MQIFVIGLNGTKETIQIQPSDSVGKLKQLICKKLEIPLTKDILISFKSKNLIQDKLTLGESNIQNNSVLHVTAKLRGGGDFGLLNFNNFSEPINIKLAQKSDPWREISQGLNLQGVCTNQDCKAYNQKVCIRKGYGKFNMTRQANDSYCPICSELCSQVNNVVLFLARCVSKGKKRGQKNQIVFESIHANEGDINTFVNQDHNKSTWLYLELDVTRL